MRELIEEAQSVIKQSAEASDKPLIVQFSGGKDSMTLVSLVREVTDNFVCSYMKSGIEFPEAVDFAKQTINKLGLDLIISTPEDHRGSFFERLPLFGWPTVRSIWCNRDLKVRPQKKVLNRLFGKGKFYKMVGVRKSESARRRKMHSKGNFFAEDYQVGTDILAYPILNWTTDDVINYLKEKKLPTSSLYKKYGISGCYWCPFYQASIYRRILKDHPNLYDPFIDWEEKLGPSVNGYIYLRDLKNEIIILERRLNEGQN